jgi:hypothetical protein
LERSRIEVASQRRIEWQARQQCGQVSAELLSFFHRQALDERERQVREFERRRDEAFRAKAAGRQSERRESHHHARERLAQSEEKHEKAMEELRQAMAARDALVESKQELKSRDHQVAAQEKLMRSNQVRDQWRETTRRHSQGLLRNRRQRGEKRAAYLQQREAELNANQEEERTLKAKILESARRSLERAEADMLEAQTRKAEDREEAAQLRREEDARMREELARANLEAHEHAAKRLQHVHDERDKAAAQVTREIEDKERRMQMQLAQLTQRRRAQAQARCWAGSNRTTAFGHRALCVCVFPRIFGMEWQESARKQEQLDRRLSARRQELDETAAAREHRLNEKMRRDRDREMQRKAVVTEQMEAHWRTSLALAARKDAYRAKPMGRRGDQELIKMSRSLTDLQVTARQRALSASKAVLNAGDEEV